MPRIVVALAMTTALAVFAPTAFAGTLTSETGQPVAGGWSSTSLSYLGSYKLTPLHGVSTVATTSPVAGVFSVAVKAATQLGTTTGPVSGGAVTVFLRKVKTGEPLAPSAILSIFGQAGNQVLYLTDLGLRGTERTAVVNGGGFLGVPIGTFTATGGTGTALDGVIKAPGLSSVHVKLKPAATPAP